MESSAWGTGRVTSGLLRWATVGILVLATVVSQAEPSKRAPGLEAPARGSKLLLLPVEVQLFSVSGGGVNEPRADWSIDARRHVGDALLTRLSEAGFERVTLTDESVDEFGEQLNLQSALARAIMIHHVSGGSMALPSKQGRLEWSVGDAMQPLSAASGARYALFIRVRDSYASTERKAAAAALAILGAFTGVVVVPSMGVQRAQAMLVDLHSGQVLWFNAVSRSSGDLREKQAAQESVDALLADFPSAQ